jgi:hypothetical protein
MEHVWTRELLECVGAKSSACLTIAWHVFSMDCIEDTCSETLSIAKTHCSDSFRKRMYFVVDGLFQRRLRCSSIFNACFSWGFILFGNDHDCGSRRLHFSLMVSNFEGAYVNIN